VFERWVTAEDADDELAALRYYRAGHVDFTVAGLLAVGFFVEASIRAIVTTRIEDIYSASCSGRSSFT